MDIESAVRFFFERPDYEKTPGRLGPEYNVPRMRALLEACGAPDARLRIIHVAGTNAKGSVCFYCEQGLLAAGERVGTFLSPHLERVNERIRIDGAAVEDAALCRVAAALAAIPAFTEATAFETLLAAACCLFVEAGCRWAVLETGVGGRLDSTNAVSPCLSIITPIGIDHRNLLGDTLAAIAAEKAGILKAGVPALLFPQEEAAAAVLEETARRVGAPLLPFVPPAGYEDRGLEGGTVELGDGRRLFLAMPGEHQAGNLSGALCGLAALGIACPEAALAGRLGSQRLPGRLEYLQGDPAFLLDGAHNPQAIARLVSLLECQRGPLVLVIAMMADKEIAANMALFAACPAHRILTTTGETRSAAPEMLAAACPCPATIARNPQAALKNAVTTAGPGALIVIAGSFHLVGMLRAAVLALTGPATEG